MLRVAFPEGKEAGIDPPIGYNKTVATHHKIKKNDTIVKIERIVVFTCQYVSEGEKNASSDQLEQCTIFKISGLSLG